MSLNATKDPTFAASGERKPHRNSRANTPIPVPQGDAAVELYAGRLDIERWALWSLGVRLNRGQRRFVRACSMRAANGYGPAFLDIAVSAGNRAGKTLVLAIVILHHTFYKMGIKPPKGLGRVLEPEAESAGTRRGPRPPSRRTARAGCGPAPAAA